MIMLWAHESANIRRTIVVGDGICGASRAMKPSNTQKPHFWQFVSRRSRSMLRLPQTVSSKMTGAIFSVRKRKQRKRKGGRKRFGKIG